jgi:hypothetical protein
MGALSKLLLIGFRGQILRSVVRDLGQRAQ